jgi:alkanesulfonate monooxygenase SsuD/methylene tetrahydromethanopterin reductase-like flavin-dependent oxidoreductase (luciferase family)
MEEEFRALGVPFHRRGALMDESLPLLRRFWDGEVVEHDGARLLVSSGCDPSGAAGTDEVVRWRIQQIGCSASGIARRWLGGRESWS